MIGKEVFQTENCQINLFGDDETQCFFWSILVRKNGDQRILKVIRPDNCYTVAEVAVGVAFKIAFFVDFNLNKKEREFQVFCKHIENMGGIIQPSPQRTEAWIVKVGDKTGLLSFDIYKGWSAEPLDIKNMLITAMQKSVNEQNN